MLFPQTKIHWKYERLRQGRRIGAQLFLLAFHPVKMKWMSIMTTVTVFFLLLLFICWYKFLLWLIFRICSPKSYKLLADKCSEVLCYGRRMSARSPSSLSALQQEIKHSWCSVILHICKLWYCLVGLLIEAQEPNKIPQNLHPLKVTVFAFGFVWGFVFLIFAVN